MNARKSPVVTELEYIEPPILVSVLGTTTMNSLPRAALCATASGTCM